MIRAYFHLHECGVVTEDPEGREVDDLSTARGIAIAEARAIMIAEVQEGRLCLSCRIDVEDEYGTLLLRVPFREAINVSGV